MMMATTRHPKSASILIAAAIGISWSAPGMASGSSDHGYRSEYAGEEKRAIKSLSAEDIKELTEGSGWGLAKAPGGDWRKLLN
jgi:pyruvoyl-dependent arginine decarboxylase (PvlArgDC)